MACREETDPSATDHFRSLKLMPNRILRDWTDSFHVEQVNAEEERLFTRLLMKADDYGRYHADPRLIMAGCFPLLADITGEQVSSWLVSLSNAELIVLYEVNGRPYLAIYDFNQRIRTRTASKFPAPDGERPTWCPIRKKCARGRAASTVRADSGEESTLPSEASDLERVALNDSNVRAMCAQRAARASHSHSHTNTHSYSGGSGGAKAPVRLHGIPWSVEEVIAYGRTCLPRPVPEEVCREFWSYFEGQARTNENGELFWVTRGEAVVTNWQVKLTAFGLQHKGHQHASNSRQQAVNGNSGTANEGRNSDWAAAARRKLERNIPDAERPGTGQNAESGS